ncbi:MAG TPA: imidazolonepropionase [Terriglobales bacterium]|jgi:imidazolonepropionase|nr:imidazolonepropionase [Terriglobales bacterium]
MPKAQPLLLANIGQLLTLRGKAPRRVPELSDPGVIEDAAVLCLDGKIAAAGKWKDVARHPVLKSQRKKVEETDCRGKVVLPGFVDSHTHLVFAAPRLVDFAKRIAGAGYEEIAAAGGGIRSSIEGVRKASVKALAERALASLGEMAAQGTTTVEAKSGYGLNAEAELKSLEAIAEAAKQWPGTVVPTLLGAHVVPKEFLGKPEKYLREVTEKMIPQAAKRKLARFVDVYCDRGAFSLEDAVRIFEAAAKHGLGVRAHVCQLTSTELWPLLRFNPASFDHMDCVVDEDIPQLARRDTVATLLPGANYFLGLEQYPPARKLIDAGVAVALATDYNPGTSPTPSMPFVLSLACTHMKMTPAEAISAATVNGACALGLQASKGSVEPGKDADLAVFEVDDYREIPYWVAAQRCRGVVMRGQYFQGGGR